MYSMQGNIVYISPLQADSMLNQANLFKRLLEECGYEAIYKSTISVEDLNRDDVAGAIWFQLATINFIGDAIVPYILGKKPKVLYVTIEGVPTKGNVAHSNIKRCEFVAVSNFVKECLQSVGLRVRKVVHHAIDWKLCGEIHKRNLLQKRQTEQLAKDRVKFIVVARDDPRKNLKGLADAMRILNQKGYEKDYVVFLITNDSAKEKFQGINNAVFLKGFGGSPHEMVLGYMACCDYLIQPSFCEGFCTLPDTNIITYNGIKPIKDIKVGDLVLTHRGRFKRVTKTFKRKYNGELIKITAWTWNNPIYLTPEHPVLAIKRPRPIEWWYTNRKPTWSDVWFTKEPRWILASEIEKGDIVYFPIPNQFNNTTVFDLKDFDKDIRYDEEYVWYDNGYSPKTGKRVKIPRFISIDEDLAKLIGIYIAEGSTNSNRPNSIEFSLGNEPDLANEIVNLMKKKFNVDSKIIRRRNTTKVVVSSKIIAKFFSSLCGLGAGNKRIPNEFLYGDTRLLKVLVEYLWRGDGSFIDTEIFSKYTVSTISRQLVNDLRVALLRLGVRCNVTKGNGRRDYNVNWSPNQDLIRHSNKSWIIDGKWLALLVRDVERVSYNGYVYNLEVERDIKSPQFIGIQKLRLKPVRLPSSA